MGAAIGPAAFACARNAGPRTAKTIAAMLWLFAVRRFIFYSHIDAVEAIFREIIIVHVGHPRRTFLSLVLELVPVAFALQREE